MSGKMKINNNNGKLVVIENPDTNNTNITIDGSQLVVKNDVYTKTQSDSLLGYKVSKISSPNTNSLIKVNADGSISNSTFTEDSSNNLVIPKAIISSNSTNGLVNRVNINKANYSFSGNTSHNALKLTIVGNTTYLSVALNITYINMYVISNQTAVRQYSYKRLAIPNTVNFSEVGTGLGSNLVHTSTTLITGGLEVIFSFPSGGNPQIDIEAINHRYASTGQITYEFLTL